MKLVLLVATICLSYSVIAQTIEVGNGGGTAGLRTVYKIEKNGKILKGEGIDKIEYTDSGKILKADAKSYISRSTQMIENATFNHPGNIYYFININKDKAVKAVTWGDTSHQVPESIARLYQEIMAEMNRTYFKPLKKPK